MFRSVRLGIAWLAFHVELRTRPARKPMVDDPSGHSGGGWMSGSLFEGSFNSSGLIIRINDADDWNSRTAVVDSVRNSVIVERRRRRGRSRTGRSRRRSRTETALGRAIAVCRVGSRSRAEGRSSSCSSDVARLLLLSGCSFARSDEDQATGITEFESRKELDRLF